MSYPAILMLIFRIAGVTSLKQSKVSENAKLPFTQSESLWFLHVWGLRASKFWKKKAACGLRLLLLARGVFQFLVFLWFFWVWFWVFGFLFGVL
jgi:hypothetical protein